MSKKNQLVALILSTLQSELDALVRSAEAAHEAATHEESRAEDSHDTRGLEASYLAGAQMARIEALRKLMASYQFAQFRDFQPHDSIDLGAVVELDLDGKKVSYLLVPQGGGRSIKYNDRHINIITPQAPLGEALMGRRVGEVVEVEGQRVSREYEIVSVS